MSRAQDAPPVEGQSSARTARPPPPRCGDAPTWRAGDALLPLRLVLCRACCRLGLRHRRGGRERDPVVSTPHMKPRTARHGQPPSSTAHSCRWVGINTHWLARRLPRLEVDNGEGAGQVVLRNDGYACFAPRTLLRWHHDRRGLQFLPECGIAVRLVRHGAAHYDRGCNGPRTCEGRATVQGLGAHRAHIPTRPRTQTQPQYFRPRSALTYLARGSAGRAPHAA